MASPLCARNPREKLHHNSAHIGSHCETESSLRKGAAENHNHDTEAIMRSGWEQDKKKNAIDGRERRREELQNRLSIGQTLRVNCRWLYVKSTAHFSPECLNKSQQRWKCQCDKLNVSHSSLSLLSPAEYEEKNMQFPTKNILYLSVPHSLHLLFCPFSFKY